MLVSVTDGTRVAEVGVTAVEVGVTAVALRTPTLPPATTTNTLIVGHNRLAVIEPATPHRDQQSILDEEIERRVGEGATVVAVCLTHHHSDHIAYARPVADRLGVPICAHPATAQRLGFHVDELIEAGWTLELGSAHRLSAIHTPGHAPGHVVFLEEASATMYGGDMVAGEGTVLIDPDDGGDMAQYLVSLRRLQDLFTKLGRGSIVPSHGPVFRDPLTALRQHVEHRLAREAKLLAAISRHGSTLEETLARTYDDVPPKLLGLAARSLEAHLRKLEDEARVERTGDRLRLT